VDKPIQVGSVIGIMVLPGDDWKSVTVPEISQAAPASSAGAATNAAAEVHHHDINQ
jgi:hypothetical protein